MKTCYGYGRHSTDMQAATEGMQRAAVEKYYTTTLKPLGYAWGGWFYDAAVSGGDRFTERPKGREVCHLADRGDTIAVYHSDRLFRNVADALSTTEWLRSRGIDLAMPNIHGADGSASGDMVATVQHAVAAYQKARAAELTRETMRHLSEQGRKFGGRLQSTPIGWQSNGPGLVVDQDERDAVEQMAQWRDAGDSYVRLEQRVLCLGWRRRRGQAWSVRYITLALRARSLGYPKAFLNAREKRGATLREPASAAP